MAEEHEGVAIQLKYLYIYAVIITKCWKWPCESVTIGQNLLGTRNLQDTNFCGLYLFSWQ